MKSLFRCFLAAVLALPLSCGVPSGFDECDEYPPIFPDYTEVTVPEGIAPLTFRMADGRRFRESRELRDGAEWVSVQAWKRGDRRGVSYKPFPIFHSTDPIDPYLVYRLIEPGYQSWQYITITQRELASYRESDIVTSKANNDGCMNCHNFNSGNPLQMMLHARGRGGGTVFTDGDEVKLVNIASLGPHRQGTYPAWHPDGRYIAFSSNNTNQCFTLNDSQPVEVYDLASDIILMDLQTDSVYTCPSLTGDEVLETFPCWSEDGSRLYYCAAENVNDLPAGRGKLHYKLMSIAFEGGAFVGEPRLEWEDADGSASFPRAKNGLVLFTRSDYGTFPIWHKEADLWIYDPASGEARAAAELNSDDTESYHSWSSEGCWTVFSSRRIDGRYTRLYLAHYEGDGRFGKPFLLPQKNPSHNELRLKSYNVPEFIRSEAPSRQKAVKKLFRQ